MTPKLLLLSAILMAAVAMDYQLDEDKLAARYDLIHKLVLQGIPHKGVKAVNARPLASKSFVPSKSFASSGGAAKSPQLDAGQLAARRDLINTIVQAGIPHKGAQAPASKSFGGSSSPAVGFSKSSSGVGGSKGFGGFTGKLKDHPLFDNSNLYKRVETSDKHESPAYAERPKGRTQFYSQSGYPQRNSPGYDNPGYDSVDDVRYGESRSRLNNKGKSGSEYDRYNPDYNRKDYDINDYNNYFNNNDYNNQYQPSSYARQRFRPASYSSPNVYDYPGQSYNLGSYNKPTYGQPRYGQPDYSGNGYGPTRYRQASFGQQDYSSQPGYGARDYVRARGRSDPQIDAYGDNAGYTGKDVTGTSYTGQPGILYKDLSTYSNPYFSRA